MSDDPTQFGPPENDGDEMHVYEYDPEVLREESVDDEWYEPPDAFVTDDEIDSDVIAASLLEDTRVRLVILVIFFILLALIIFRACSGKEVPSSPQPGETVEVVKTPAGQATFTPTPLPVEVVTVAPTATAPPPTSTPLPGALRDGMMVTVSHTDGQGIRFRAGPGTTYVTIEILEEGARLKVVGGPEEADGFTWWRLQADDGFVGWAVEDFLEPAGE